MNLHPQFYMLALACTATMLFGTANMMHARDIRFMEVPRRRYFLHLWVVLLAGAAGAFTGFHHGFVSWWLIHIGIVLMTITAICEGWIALRVTIRRVKTLHDREARRLRYSVR